MVKEDYSEYDGIGGGGNHSGMSSAQTTMKPTGDSGMSGHLCVEDTVIDFRVDDKNVMDSFLSERPWVYHVEVGSQLQPEKLDRISVTDCKHSRQLSMQEEHDR